MSFFGWGNRSVNFGSTATTARGSQANPTTSVMLADIDFNGSNATVKAGGQVFGVTWIVGVGTTLAVFNCEHVQSTNIDMAASTTFRGSLTVEVSSGQSAQYFTKHEIQPGDRLRVRVETAITGSANAYISAEPLD